MRSGEDTLWSILAFRCVRSAQLLDNTNPGGHNHLLRDQTQVRGTSLMSERFEDAEAQVQNAEKRLVELRQAYKKCLHEQTISRDLKVGVTEVVNSLRSALDYCAKEVSQKCGVTGQEVYFPVACKGFNPTAFQGLLCLKIPGVKGRPDLEPVFASFQEFADPAYSWLPDFATLSNDNKHDHLTPQKREETERIVAEWNSQMAAKVLQGDLSAGGEATSDTELRCLFPPLVAHVERGGRVIVGGVEVEPGKPHPALQMRVTGEVWVDFKFDGIDQPVLPFLRCCVDGVRKIVTTLKDKV
jgi:hypothetical protein